MAALAENPKAKAAFDALEKTERYRLYLPVLQARTGTTRANRLRRMIAELEVRPPTDRGAAKRS